MAAIECYVLYLKLTYEYINNFSEVKDQIKKRLDLFMKGDHYRTKLALGDMGEFVNILMFATDNFYKDKQIMDTLLREYMARQVMWIVK